MSENVRSLIRHLLTIVGGLLTVFGLTKYSGVLEYVSNSVEPIYAAVTAVIGFCVTLYGYFKDSSRFAVRVEDKAIKEVSSSK